MKHETWLNIQQIMSSSLVHDLGIDWHIGAEWLLDYDQCWKEEQRLLDYDQCSNYWTWLATLFLIFSC
jgi:deoxyribodipyrimidine photolyase